MQRDFFFITGSPRSGTTLLSVMLDRHSRLCVTPETGYFDELAPRIWFDSERLALRALRRWRRLPELQLSPEEVMQRAAHRRPLRIEVLAAILELYAAARGKARCGEKTPQHLRHTATILDAFPNARVVCVLRNGIDASLSLASMPWYPGDLRDAAVLWLRFARMTDDFSARYADRFHVVRYEDLVATPESTLRRVMHFLCEEFEPQQLSTDVASGVVLARSLEWKGEALRDVNAGAATRRKSEARAQDIALLEQLLGDELRKRGY